MSMKNTLLGMMAIFGPRTGYALHRRLVKPLRPTLPQIYHVLTNMKREGLIEYIRKKGNEPDKNLCALTPKGYSKLQQWLKEERDISPMNESVMHKLWYGSFTDLDTILESLTTFRDYRKDEVEYYEHLKDKMLDSPTQFGLAKSSSTFYCSLALDFLIARGKAEVASLEDIIVQIQLNSEKLINNTCSKRNTK